MGMEGWDSMTRVAEHDYLTPREKELMYLLSWGYESDDVCREMKITYNTLRTMRANVKRRLHATSSVHAMAIWMRAEGADYVPERIKDVTVITNMG